MEWEELPGLFPGFSQPGRWLPLLRAHHELLETFAAHTRVTAVGAEDAVRRHYAESLETWRIAREAVRGGRQSLVDVGSGGGFPGLVIACLEPAMQVALVEPLQKRARLLAEVSARMGLENVTILAERAETAGRGPLRDRADIVTARAVAPLNELIEYVGPFAREGGIVALPKGSGFGAELAEAEEAIGALGCAFERFEPMRPEISETLGVAILQKTGPTEERFPRRAGVPGKRPIGKRSPA